MTHIPPPPLAEGLTPDSGGMMLEESLDEEGYEMRFQAPTPPSPALVPIPLGGLGGLRADGARPVSRGRQSQGTINEMGGGSSLTSASALYREHATRPAHPAPSSPMKAAYATLKMLYRSAPCAS
ncbi:hypothetical protein PAPYR_12528 [Paratrimastix pyriformis]|uniref:Uncharacterized protein n=1 Tax=Paratrimastix pyriformis TaxID=342808 RepID=A0ABQ8U1P6_9EUKA|nr:hypothetical protein PAPYR_12528 [Paratrimastix pyriformis]